MAEITKSDIPTGVGFWRFGNYAQHNHFELLDDPIGFSHQHDACILPNGHISLFDNGNMHIPKVSRALEYRIDEINLTATLMWSYRHIPDKYSPAMGNYQHTSQNKHFVGWGWLYPLASTEVTSEGLVTMEIFMPNTVQGYRSYKFPWKTNLFETTDSIFIESYEGEIASQSLNITNNAGHIISITSSYNMRQEFFTDAIFPIEIQPGETKTISVLFDPSFNGFVSDVFTLNIDNEGNTQRIASQTKIYGYLDDVIPQVELIPENGSTGISPDTVVRALFSEIIRDSAGNAITSEYLKDIFEFRETDSAGVIVSFSGLIHNDQLIDIYPDLLLKEDQEYYVRLKPGTVRDVAGNFLNESQITVFQTSNLVNIPAIEKNTNIRIYPNPAGEYIAIDFDEPLSEEAEIVFINARGNTEFVKHVPVNTIVYKIPLTGMREGIYAIIISDSFMKLHKKLLIVN
jgi:hypothetical protein